MWLVARADYKYQFPIPMNPWLSQFFSSVRPDDDQPLQVRLFRLVCGTTAFLCLAVVLPVNLLQNLPLGVHLGDGALGLVAVFCLWASRRGRHYYVGFFAVFLLLLNPVWFLNGGSNGSVSFYFAPILIYPLAIYRGRARLLVSILVVLDFSGLLLTEYYFPELTVPLHSTADRVIDLITGAGCSMLALGVLIWLIVATHEREQERITRYARDLIAGEANYHAIFNSTSDALLVYDASGRLIDVNDRMCAMFSCDRATALGLSIGQRSLGLSPYSESEAAAKIQLAITVGPQVFRWRSRRVNGELFWSEVELSAADIAGQKRLIAAVREIGARVQAEETLRTQEERLRLALAASNQGWFDLNLVTGEGTASGEYARIIGLEPVEFKVSAKSWQEGIHPDDRDAIVREFQACIAEGGTRTMEYRRQGADGEWKWIRSTGMIVERDARGRALRMTGTHADITERKRLEAQLLHSQRLESVGTLAGGVAHDLNNILTPMLMVGTLLRDKLADPMDRAILEQMEAGAKRGAAIVRQLLTFSRDLPQTRLSVDLAKQIEEMMDIMRGTFPREIKLVSRLPDGLWPVTADPIQLHQVLMNLCINARDAMPAGGTLVVAAVNHQPEEAVAKGARMVGITVSDTGQGIKTENLNRIFDPFFTTKGVGKGTGLGLSTVHGIVKSHGGYVTVCSELNCGTTFQVILPASTTMPAVASAPPVAQVRGPAHPLVLVIDDEPSVLAMTARILEREGCEVVTASGGEQALKLVGGLADRLKLIITDMMMPGMDGPTLVPLLRQVCPAAKIVGVSGLDFDHRSSQLNELGFAEILRKPYDLDTLVAAVRRHVPV